jgi:hypothetical protein
MRWSQELAMYDFKIVYRPGNKNGNPDALSKYSKYRPNSWRTVEEHKNQPITSLLKPEIFG